MKVRGLGAWILVMLLVVGAATPAWADDGDEDGADEVSVLDARDDGADVDHEEDGRDEDDDRDDRDDDDDDDRDDRGGRVILVSDKVPAVTAGDTVWISLTWRADGLDATDFRVVATKTKGVDVSYPANTGSYTSLWADDTLSDGELDFTALRLDVPYDAKRAVRIQLEVSYKVNGQDRADVYVGKRRTKRVTLRIPVQAYTGADVAQVNLDPQTVVAGSGAWIDIAYTGYAPRVDGFQVVVTDAAGLALEYPQGNYTSLVHDAVLEDGETDVARVYVDASGATPGDYTLSVEASWSKAGTPGSLAGTVAVTVVAP